MTGKPTEQSGASGIAGTVSRDRLSVSTAKTSITVELDVLEVGALDLWIADQPDPKPSPGGRVKADARGAGEEVIRP
jgi:hypothetical protein